MESIAPNQRVFTTDIADMLTIEAGEMNISREHVNVVPLILETAEAARILVGTKPVIVEVKIPAVPVMITIDPVKLRQIITNLMINSVMFTKQGKITIALSIIGSRLEITVSNTGTEIKEKDLGEFFTALGHAGYSKTEKQGGTGLSLTIRMNLDEPQGQIISIKSAYGIGTTYVVSLPLQHVDGQRGLYNAE